MTALFLASLLIPSTFMLGSLSLSVYRVFLLALFVPCTLSWLMGRAGKIRLPDVLLLAYCLWCFVCLLVHDDPGRAVASFGMQLVETMGAFLLARRLIRTADDFLAMTRTLFKLALFLLPFSLVELISHRDVIAEFFLAAPLPEGDTRLGLQRVQSVFPHPILYGVFGAACFSLFYNVLGYGRSLPVKFLKASPSVLTALFSLSSAPIAAIGIQLAILFWERVLAFYKARWHLLVFFLILSVAVLETFSNQGAVGFYISHLTFQPQTGFYRIAIWDYGTASILNNPMFGVGLGDWVRASWMTPSIDNFWLIAAIRWGIVGGMLLVLAILTAFLRIALSRQPDNRSSQYKQAYLLAVFIHIFTGWTVHFWANSYVFFFFLLGSGFWLLETKVSSEKPDQKRSTQGAASRRGP